MKRFFVLTLTLLLLCAALGESDQFALRNGIAWGMSAEEVLKREGNPAHETDKENGLDIVRIPKAEHEGAACTLEYLFFDGTLAMIRADYGKDAALEDLKDALSKQYGEATRLTREQLRELTMDEDPADTFYGWVLDSYTLVCLTADTAAGTLRVLYCDIVATEG